MKVRNRAIPHRLHNFWLLTSASPIYSWIYHIPLESILYPRDNGVHSQTIISCSTHPVKIKQSHHLCIYIKKCYYVFVNVCKATSYAIGKLIAFSSNGLLFKTVFIELQIYYDNKCFCKMNYLFFFSFYKILIHHKILHIEWIW